jgi:hypothetical protein
MGLEWVEVSLNDIFEEGQGYVGTLCGGQYHLLIL